MLAILLALPGMAFADSSAKCSQPVRPVDVCAEKAQEASKYSAKHKGSRIERVKAAEEAYVAKNPSKTPGLNTNVDDCRKRAEACGLELIEGTNIKEIVASGTASARVSAEQIARYKDVAIGTGHKNGRELELYEDVSADIAVLAVAQGYARADELYSELIENYVKVANDPKQPEKTRTYYARVQAHAEERLIRFYQREIEACHVSHYARDAKNQDWRQFALLCDFRLNYDLSEYPLLEQWPGCPCGGNRGRFIRNVCVTGVSPLNPIDGRMPEALGTFIDKMQKWGKEQKPPLQMTGVEATGCGLSRFGKGSDTERFEETSKREVAGKRGYWIDMRYISAHAESRACDIKSMTFAKIGCTGSACSQTLNFEGANGATPFAQALSDYAARTSIPMQPGGTPIPGKVGENRANAKFKYGRGVADWRALEKQLQEGGCPIPNPEECGQLIKGVAARNALVDSGFLVIDPIVNGDHAEHFHAGLPARKKFWDMFKDENTPVKVREKLERCAVSHEADLEFPDCGETKY